MNITIDPIIRDLTPAFSIGVMTATVAIDTHAELDQLINDLEQSIRNKHDISEVVTMDIILDGRDAYRAYGKDPSRYRLAVESLYRRIIKGNHLYRINNVVDLGNVLSLMTRKSVAVLDRSQIEGDVRIRLGQPSDDYHGLGRGKLNVTDIPVYVDDRGPFGSTTSDTERTKIRPQTREMLLFIISFSGAEVLSDELTIAVDLYTRFASAKNVKTWII